MDRYEWNEWLNTAEVLMLMRQKFFSPRDTKKILRKEGIF